MRSVWRSFSGRGRRFHDNHSPYVQEGGLEKVFVKYVPLTGGLLIGDQASAWDMGKRLSRISHVCRDVLESDVNKYLSLWRIRVLFVLLLLLGRRCCMVSAELTEFWDSLATRCCLVSAERTSVTEFRDSFTLSLVFALCRTDWILGFICSVAGVWCLQHWPVWSTELVNHSSHERTTWIWEELLRLRKLLAPLWKVGSYTLRNTLLRLKSPSVSCLSD